MRGKWFSHDDSFRLGFGEFWNARGTSLEKFPPSEGCQGDCRTDAQVTGVGRRAAGAQAAADEDDSAIPFLGRALAQAFIAHTPPRCLATLRRRHCKPMNIKTLAMALCAAALSFGAQAIDLSPGGVFVQGGVADRGGYSLTAGVIWPWSWQRQAAGGEWSGLTEAYVSHWSGRVASARESFTQLGLVPIFRYRFSQGRSDWFTEAGIGVSAMDNRYQIEEKQFGTRFNFVDVLGLGRSFGAQRDRELSLRLTHFSNGGIKEPNPGENFLLLRYAALF
jgi:lipid A 3-O-deacylase